MRKFRTRLPFGRKKEKNALALDKPRSEYYENVSVRLGTAQVVLYLVLLAFVVLSFLFNTELITYRNFYLFFQDLNASAETVDVFRTDSLSYPMSEKQSFALYRKGLAVAGNTSVTVFSATGRQIVSESVNYSNPVAVGSGQYLLVYEMGGRQYSLYNSYTQIHAGKSEYPINGAAVSESGAYALISSSRDSTSTVSLYNDRFKQIGRYGKSGYVTDVAINEKGTMMAIMTAFSDGGLLSTEVMLIKPGREEPTAKTTLQYATGVDCAFTEGGGVSIICSDGIYTLNGSGKITESHSFDGRVLRAYDLSENGACVCLKKNNVSQKNVVIVFDKNGKVVYNKDVTDSVEQLSRSGRTLFCMTDAEIFKIDLRTGNVASVGMKTVGGTLLAISEQEALCCFSQKADYVSFRN